MSHKRDGTPTPLSPADAPDLPPLTFDIDDVTGHYPIGALGQQVGTGHASENPLEFPGQRSSPLPPLIEERVERTPPRPQGFDPSQVSPMVLLVGSLFVGTMLAVGCVLLVVIAMAILGW